MTENLVISAFEACTAFVGDEHVCEACGWLDHEHEVVAAAEVEIRRAA